MAEQEAYDHTMKKIKAMGLTAEMRRSVAEAVNGEPYEIHNERIYLYGACIDKYEWDPAGKHFKALITKTAQLIVECQHDAEDVDQRAKVHDDRLSFVEYLATSAVHDIEALLFELLEAQ